jgi:uncharacterized protein (TIGR02231 family)
MIGLTTTIIAATVFPDWVRLTRRGTLELDKGTHTVEIFGLPENINPETFHVTLYGPENPRLLAVQLNEFIDTNHLLDSVVKLEKEIFELDDDLKQLADKNTLIVQNRGILDKLMGQTDTYATALASGVMTAEKQIEALDQLRFQAQRLNEELHSLQVTERQKQQQREKLTAELDEARWAVPQKTYTAAVDIELSKSAALTLEISYVVPGVSWEPVYELRLLEKGGEPSLEVSYMADLTQATGENWNDITLTFSTARPALSASLPNLEPWFVNLRKLSAFKTTEGDETQIPDLERSPVPLPDHNDDQKNETGERPEVKPSALDKVDTAVSYLINNPVSIPSDNFNHKVPIARFFLDPVLEYYTTPKLSQAVYRQARVDNTSPYTLLPGQSSIIVGDEYVGSIQLELSVPGDTLEVFLGNDNRINVERELRRRDVDKKMLWGKRHYIVGYQIKVESLLHHQAVLTVYDQIPLPTHEDIKVKLESASPKPAEQTKLNQLMWNLVLEPKETRSLDFEFSVDAPAGMDIVGL